MSGDRYFIRDPEAIYFLTATVVRWLDIFIHARYKRVIVDSLNYCIMHKGLKVYAWCLMSSHLHLIVAAQRGFNLSAIIRDFKKHTATKTISLIQQEPESNRELFLNTFEEEGLSDKRITRFKFWKPDNHAIEMQPWENHLLDQKINYIHMNPVEAGLVKYPESYLHSSARDYAGFKGLVNVELL